MTTMELCGLFIQWAFAIYLLCVLTYVGHCCWFRSIEHTCAHTLWSTRPAMYCAQKWHLVSVITTVIYHHYWNHHSLSLKEVGASLVRATLTAPPRYWFLFSSILWFNKNKLEGKWYWLPRSTRKESSRPFGQTLWNKDSRLEERLIPLRILFQDLFPEGSPQGCSTIQAISSPTAQEAAQLLLLISAGPSNPGNLNFCKERKWFIINLLQQR